MTDKDKEEREKETLDSGAGGDLAYGQDPRRFGAGGQVNQRPVQPGRDDAPQRDVERDESLPEDEHPSRSER